MQNDILGGITKFWWNYTCDSYDILQNPPDSDDSAILYIPNSHICRNLYYKLRKTKSITEAMKTILNLF